MIHIHSNINRFTYYVIVPSDGLTIILLKLLQNFGKVIGIAQSYQLVLGNVEHLVTLNFLLTKIYINSMNELQKELTSTIERYCLEQIEPHMEHDDEQGTFQKKIF